MLVRSRLGLRRGRLVRIVMRVLTLLGTWSLTVGVGLTLGTWLIMRRCLSVVLISGYLGIRSCL